jgi:hypothetical protein
MRLRKVSGTLLVALHALVLGGLINLLAIRGLVLAYSHWPAVYNLLDRLIPYYVLYGLALLALVAVDGLVAAVWAGRRLLRA